MHQAIRAPMGKAGIGQRLAGGVCLEFHISCSSAALRIKDQGAASLNARMLNHLPPRYHLNRNAEEYGGSKAVFAFRV
jgi:hypothetical protein